ncbi:MAG: hypothetical protein V4537_14290 [Pseudomonadota bacterium]
MRVISLHQPWASLWVAGRPYGKDIETRPWSTPYRGLVAVHAALTLDREACLRPYFDSALAAIGFDYLSEIPLGKIVGVVELVDCLEMTVNRTAPPGGISIAADPRLTPQELAFGNYAIGRFAWTTGPLRRRLKEPLPHRGAQGLRPLPLAVIHRMSGR